MPESCGCRIDHVIHDATDPEPGTLGTGFVIVYCPLQAAAPALVEACQKVEHTLNGRDAKAWFPVEVRQQIQKALALATGQPKEA